MNKWLVIFVKIVEKLFYGLAGLMVAFAAIYSLTFLATPFAAKQKTSFENTLTTLLHHKVTIDSVSVGWQSFYPALQLQGVSIALSEKSNTFINVDTLSASLSPIQSLLKKQWVVHQVSAEGSTLRVVEGEGQLTINGVVFKQGKSSQANNDAPFQFLLTMPRLELQHINVSFEDKQGKLYSLYNVGLLLANEGQTHDLRGIVNFSPAEKNPIAIALHFEGDGNPINDNKVLFYSSVKKLNLLPLSFLQNFHGFDLKKGKLSGELWATFEQGKITDITTEFDLSNVQLEALSDHRYFVINNLAADLYLKRLESNTFELSGDNIKATFDEHSWKKTAFDIYVKNTASDNADLLLKMDYLNLSDINIFLENLTDVPKTVRNFLKTYEPDGVFNHIYFTHQGRLSDLTHHFYLETDFNSLAFHYQNTHISGLAGVIKTTDRMGQMNLQGSNVTLADMNMFVEPLNLDTLQMKVQWQRLANQSTIDIVDLALNDDTLAVSANAHFVFPKRRAASMAIFGQVDEKDLSRLKNYLPLTLPKGLHTWLSEAFVSGDSLQSQFLVSGNVKDFPYSDRQGQFLVSTKLYNADIHYGTDWPDVTAMDATLIFHRVSMHLEATKGKIENQPIQHLIVDIPDLVRAPVVKVNALVQINELKDAFTIMFTSPLKENLGKSLQGLSPTGKAELSLYLGIPLEADDNQIDGKLIFNDANLSLSDFHLNLQKLNGPFLFNNEKIASSRLTGEILGYPFTLNIQTLSDVQKNSAFYFNLKSHTTIDTLKNYFSLPTLSFIQGETDYEAQLVLPQVGSNSLTVNSALKGISINAPVPLGKASADLLPFSLKLYFQGNHPGSIVMSVKNTWHIALYYAQNESLLSRISIMLGSKYYSTPTEPGIYVEGDLNIFSVAKWQDFLSQFSTDENSAQSALPPLKKVAVNIATLETPLQDFHYVNLLLTRAANSAWKGAVRSEEATGDFTVVTEPTLSVSGNFDTLSLMPKQTATANSQVSNSAIFNKIPSLDIMVDNFYYEGKFFGIFHLALKKTLHAISIEQLLIKNDLYELATQGNWQQASGRDYSNFSGVLKISNIQNFAKEMSLPHYIDNGSGTLNFSLAFLGAPWEGSLMNTAGNIDAALSKGVIVGLSNATNEKIGLGKVINALSLSSITNLLSLNFSSITQKGLDFSTLSGNLKLQQGIISTDNFYLDSSVTEAYLQGKVDFNLGAYDLDLKLNPYYTSSLPVLVGFVINPLAGVATWAANKAIHAQMGALPLNTYHISGTFDDPSITEMAKKS